MLAWICLVGLNVLGPVVLTIILVWDLTSKAERPRPNENPASPEKLRCPCTLAGLPYGRNLGFDPPRLRRENLTHKNAHTNALSRVIADL